MAKDIQNKQRDIAKIAVDFMKQNKISEDINIPNLRWNIAVEYNLNCPSADKVAKRIQKLLRQDHDQER